MSEEDKKMLIEMKENCLNASVYDDENRLLKANAITNVLKEIERLKGNIEILSDDLGNIGYMLGLEEGSCYEDVLEEIRKLQQKENIIKEVRELLSKYNDNESNYYAPIDMALYLLDKENKE